MYKKFVLLILVLCITSLCACGLDSTDNTTPNASYTVADQEMFRFEGICVSVVPGQYTDDPEFHVTNTSEQNYWVALDTVAYDNILLPTSTSNAGTVYKVLAGADQKLSECERYNTTTFQYITVAPDGFVANGTGTDSTASTGISFNTGTGNLIFQATTQTEIKREYRFAVYSIDPDHLPETGKGFVPQEDDLLYRSDLILLQSSDYDESKVSKQLPSEAPLLSSDGITIWRNSASYNISGSSGSMLQLKVSPSFVIDNNTDADIRVELTLTQDPNRPNEEDKSEKEDPDKKDKDDKEDIPDPTSYILQGEIPAGHASRNINNSGNSKAPSWLTSGSLIVEIRIYDLATGNLILEQTVATS